MSSCDCAVVRDIAAAGTTIADPIRSCRLGRSCAVWLAAL